MRTTSLAALFCSAMFLFCLGYLDDDDTVGDDDDAEFEDVTIEIDAIKAFMGYDGDGTAEGGESLGHEYLEFEVMIAEDLLEILRLRGTTLDGTQITFPGNGDTVYFAGTNPNYVHAPCSGKVVGPGQVLVTVNHVEDYTVQQPGVDTHEVDEEGHTSFVVQGGESMTINVNYDSSGTWTCWWQTIETYDTVGHAHGEKFGQWFSGVDGQGLVMYANGHHMGLTFGDDFVTTISATISEDGETLTGLAVDKFDTWQLDCENGL
jgi:hypothetical protein